MKFVKMCEMLLKGEHKIAYNTEYPDLFTNIRIYDKGNAGRILYYFLGDMPNVPVVITQDIFESDGWDWLDDYSERLNIQEFMRMPHAKEFLKELYDTINSEWNGRFAKSFTEKEGYQMRMREAIALGIIIGDRKKQKLYFTDIGEDLIKTL